MNSLSTCLRKFSCLFPFKKQFCLVYNSWFAVFFKAFKMYHISLSCKISAEKPTGSHMITSLYMTNHLSLAALRILFLSLSCSNWIKICLGVDPFWFNLFGTFLALWIWVFIFSLGLKNFQPLFLWIKFLPHALSLPFWDSYHV